MARSINRLSPRTVSSLSETGRYADGGGLYLQVSRSGTKAWLFRFQMYGRARQMGLGPVHTVSLAEAREQATECRKLVREGIDPIEARKEEQHKRQLEAISSMTFKECAVAYMKAHEAGWKNVKHAAQWRSTLESQGGGKRASRSDVTVHGGVVDPAYTRLLMKNTNLPLDDVLALDRVQKKLPVPDDTVHRLRRAGLIEGRNLGIKLTAGKSVIVRGMRSHDVMGRAASATRESSQRYQ